MAEENPEIKDGNEGEPEEENVAAEEVACVFF